MSQAVAAYLRALEERMPPLAVMPVAILAISTSAILIRLSDAPTFIMATYRVVITVAFLLPFALTRYREDFARLDRRDLVVAGVSGTLLAIHFATWFESVVYTSVAASTTLVQSQPLFVALGAWALLDERVTRRMVVGIVIAIGGMLVMSFGDFLSGVALTGPRPLYGNALAVVGAVAAAGYVLAGRSLRQHIALVPYVTVVYSVCAVVLLGLAVQQDLPLTGYPTHEWVLFTVMAVGPGIFGHTVINWVLAHVESSVVSVSLLGEPVGSTLLALVFLAEVPSVMTLVGGAVVLAGIYVTAQDREQRT